MAGWQEQIAAFLLVTIFAISCWGQTKHSTFQKARPQEVSVEVFQVLELPLLVHEATLVKEDKGYLLRCSLSNSSESKMIGLRYSLAIIDESAKVRPVVSRSEGIAIEAYSSKRPTFQTPIQINLKDGQHLIMMLEQTMSFSTIWDVVKAKEALEAYAAGDYSKIPNVIRVANQVDAPLPAPRVIYRD